MVRPTKAALVRVAARALEEGWGIRGASVRCLRDYWNAVFRVRHEGRSVLLRLHSPRYHDARAVASELEWLRALGEHAAMPVAVPLPDVAGRYVPVLDLPGLGPRACTLLGWVEGRRLSRIGRASCFELGALAATLHAHASAWRRPAGFERPRWEAATLSRYLFHPHDDCGWRGLPRGTRRLFRSVLDRLERAERALKCSHPREHGLVHADLHRGNVIRGPSGLVPIDFDDCGFGSYLYDLAVPLTHERRSASSPHAAALIAGYRSVRPIDDEVVAHLDAFIAGRAVVVALFVRGFAQDDPRFVPYVEPAVDAASRFVRAL